MKRVRCFVSRPCVVDDTFRRPGVPFLLPLAVAIRYKDRLIYEQVGDEDDKRYQLPRPAAGTSDVDTLNRQDRMQRKDRARGWIE